MSLKSNSSIKQSLHERNRNREKYDLDALVEAIPELKEHIIPNKRGEDSINFMDPRAVKLLNQGLLKHYYHIDYWDFPDTNLCPPIPGRADYLHYIADLLSKLNNNTIPKGDTILGLDVGVGASCIYPLIGMVEYNWNFIASDVNESSIKSAQQILDKNSQFKGKVELRLQDNKNNIFEGIIKENEKIDFAICNPPFHASIEEAEEGTRRKVRNLTGERFKTPPKNFAGMSRELIYDGGELSFIRNMIKDSKKFSHQCLYFSTLVSKQTHVNHIGIMLEDAYADEIRIIPTGTGNKASRIMAWSFLTVEEQEKWAAERWGKVD